MKPPSSLSYVDSFISSAHILGGLPAYVPVFKSLSSRQSVVTSGTLSRYVGACYNALARATFYEFSDEAAAFLCKSDNYDFLQTINV